MERKKKVYIFRKHSPNLWIANTTNESVTRKTCVVTLPWIPIMQFKQMQSQ